MPIFGGRAKREDDARIEQQSKKDMRQLIEREAGESEDDYSEDETRGKKRSARVKKHAVMHSGVSADTADAVEFVVLRDILERAKSPVRLLDKVKLYSPYIVIASLIVSFVIAAFWDVFYIQGTMTWYAGVIVMLVPCFLVYIYAVEIRESAEKKYPLWYDVNMRSAVNYMKVGDEGNYVVITPVVIDKQRVIIPPNPFGDGYLKIAVDKHCVYENEAGMASTGKMYRDGTSRADLRVEMDMDFVPNPEAYKLLFELNLTMTKLAGEKELRIELKNKYDSMRKLIVEDEIDYITSMLRRLLPFLSLMVRSREQDMISDIEITDRLMRSGLDMSGMSNDAKMERVAKLRQLLDEGRGR